MGQVAASEDWGKALGRKIQTLTAVAAILMTLASHTAAQERTLSSATTTRSGAPVVTTDGALHASLQRIFRGSSTWRHAMEAVRRTGRQAFVVTPTDAIAATARNESDRERFDSAGVAEVVPAVAGDSRVTFVLVTVNVPLLQRLHDERLSTRRDFEADLDRILVHEIYGHAIPYLLTGSLSAKCPDPKTGERAADACSIRRENVIRAELGLGRRSDAGLESLSLARGGSRY